jgi:uncharacterized protein YlaI
MNIQVAFYDALGAEIEFQWPFDTSKNRRCRLWVLRAIRLLKTTLHRLRPKRLFECPECRKCVQISFRHHETSFHGQHQSRFLIRSQGRLWVLSAFRLLQTSLKQLRPIRFFPCPECIQCVRMAFLHHETSIHRRHQSRILIRSKIR